MSLFVSQRLCLVFLAGIALLTGCMQVPETYVGQFAGHLGSEEVLIDLSASELRVAINGKVQTIKPWIRGFDAAVKSIGEFHGGAYILPTPERVQGIPVSGPWMPRGEWSIPGHYDERSQWSERYLDLYGIIPLDTDHDAEIPFSMRGEMPHLASSVEGREQAFYAFVFYTKLDTQAEFEQLAIDVEIAPKAKLRVMNLDMGVGPGVDLRMKEFEITPCPEEKPLILKGSLFRKQTPMPPLP